MQVNITTAVLGLVLAAVLVGGAFGFVATKAFVPAETVEVAVPAALTETQERQLACYGLAEVYFSSSEEDEDAAWEAIWGDPWCWP